MGAENDEGTAGAQITGPPTEDLRVTSTPGAPGGTLTYTMKIKGVQRRRRGTVTTGTSTPQVKGMTDRGGQDHRAVSRKRRPRRAR